MLKGYLVSFGVLMLLAITYGLNAFVTYNWRTPTRPKAPLGSQASKILPLLLGAASATLLLRFGFGLTWQLGLTASLTAVLVMAARHMFAWIRLVAVLAVATVVFVAVQGQGVHAAMLVWIMPMLGMLGVVQVLVRLGRKTWVWWIRCTTSIWVWLLLLLVAYIVDVGYGLDHQDAGAKLHDWGLFAHAPSDETPFMIHFGLLTPYVGFGLVGVLALRGRERNVHVYAWLPTTLLASSSTLILLASLWLPAFGKLQLALSLFVGTLITLTGRVIEVWLTGRRYENELAESWKER